MLNNSFSAIAILTASLLGSLHCAGMCGGFAGLAAHAQQPRAAIIFGYNLGRLITYIILGSVAGFFGSKLNDLAMLEGIAQMSALVVGILLVTLGLFTFYTERSIETLFLKLRISPAIGFPFKQAIALIMHKMARFPASFRALLIGLATTLLPCGWLYSFVAIAVASGSTVNGIAVMTLFWLGTLPVMTSVTTILNLLTSSLKISQPRLTALLIILAGTFSLFSHFNTQTHARHIGIRNLSPEQIQCR
ncbi:sulfite exporter TauE/SafE family protein [bacterium]|nr:sulfite exporter TauE/SafE family protein [bacterium]